METLKNSTISAKIIELRLQGLSVREAIAAVLGAGTYDRLASEVYHSLRGE